MNSKTIAVQFFEEDYEKISQLAKELEGSMGGKIGKRIAIMYAVNKLLKHDNKDYKDRKW